MNIYDIAKEAGVSISTVSRVMNKKGNVNPATRKKVEEILEKNNYTPSAIARGMVSKTMKTVAILTVDIRVPHYSRTAYTIEREFSRRGYEVILCNTGGELLETAKYLRAVQEKKVDGIVLVGSVFNTLCKDEEIGKLLKNTPVVLANGKLELPNSYSVLVDDRYGVAMAVDHLMQKGYRKLYYLKDMDTVSARFKCEGFFQGLQSHGIQNGKDYVIMTERSIEGGMRAVNQLLHAGLRVPEDVAVTGYNNSDYAIICEPELTTVDNKPEMVAMMSVQLLTSLIEKTDAYSSCTIQPELVKGHTS